MQIVKLEGHELHKFLEHIGNVKNAGDDVHTVRLGIDSHGLTIRVNGHVWSPPYGKPE